MTPARVPYGRLIGRLFRVFSPDSLRPFGLRRTLVLLLFVPVFLAVQGLHWIGLLLDELLFPGYRRVEVREPLFVVGPPRTGTSYLQRVLARDARFTTLRLWELLLAPSVTERKLLRAAGAADRAVGRPFGRLLRRLLRGGFAFMEDVHPVDPAEPEEDYFFLLPAFACFLLVVPFPFHPAVWALTRFDAMEDRERRALTAFYRSCVQRHLYLVGPGRTFLSKNPSFTPMIRSLVEAFPDARFVCSLRHPRESVPSLLSSLDDGARAFGWDVRTPELRDRFLDMLEHFARYAVDALSELPEERRGFVPLPRLRADVDATVRELYERFGWSPDDAFARALQAEAERARAHRSGHDYSLDQFGLEAEDLDRRFASLLDRFDLAGAGTP